VHVQVGQGARDQQGAHPSVRAANVVRQWLRACLLQQQQLPRRPPLGRRLDVQGHRRQGGENVLGYIEHVAVMLSGQESQLSGGRVTPIKISLLSFFAGKVP
jgi:hypothetical protein